MHQESIKRYFTEHRQDLIDAVCRLIRFESVKGMPVGDMPFGSGPAAVLKEALSMAKEMGFSTHNYENSIGAVDLQDGARQLDILVHLDVVPAGDGWTITEPFCPVIQDGCLYGRGSADDKGPAVAALFAMKAVKDLGIPLRKSVRLLLGTDEENGCGDTEYYYAREAEAPMTISPDASYPVIYIEKGGLQPTFYSSWKADNVLPRVRTLDGGVKGNVIPSQATMELEGFDRCEIETLLREAQRKTDVAFSIEALPDDALLVTATGSGAHASLPTDGNNALTALLELAAHLPAAPCEGFKKISALHEYWQYNHMRANFVERKKYSEDGEYSYSTNNFFQFAYEVVGDKLYMGLEALITDEEDETKLEYYVQDREEWTEYSYGFDGLDLILSKDGKCTRLKSFSMLYAEKKNEGIYEWGYAESSTAGYDGIVHIAMSTEEGYDSSIEWADGKRAENVTAQIEGNQFALTWDSTYRYDYDLGEAEEGEGGKLTGIFLLTARPNGGADGGLSICVDGEWYPYVYDSTAYWNGELSDNLETDADVSSMSEDELGELKENQTAVSSGLMGAFKEQGLDSTKIDESTGTVQMDNNVLFAWDKADLSEEGKAYLDQFLAAYVPVISSAIEDGKVSTIVVEGYTDSAGDEAYNLKLSEERAKTVADYIKAGYPELANVIEVVGNGENNLILDGEGKEDAAASRRVEVRYVLKTE